MLDMLYRSHAHTINQYATRKARVWHGDSEEFVAQANLLFCQAVKKFQPRKGPFRPRLLIYLRNLNRWQIAEKSKAKQFPRESMSMGDIEAKREFNLHTFLDELSPLAQEAVWSALEFELDGYTGHGKLRLIRKLKRRGWTKERIARVFREIQEALN